ncbi:phage portal protein [Sinorhizobium meliloti]|uniref:phage portal protein n=1 Tax=Rhizobium meliloti TaxID=382 RepID=UPI000FDC431C|nr:phage portal protein [Sinorhizobium meliloti]RVM17661.1 phage portal protein [Sinorhizobium meliloti]RVO20515.1 phage portal protein [Sinorhizobium meliloti]
MSTSVILDHNGRPMQRASVRQRGWPGSDSAYQAASYTHPDMSDWVPRSVSGQSALSTERDVMVDRVQDIARNDGWASAAMSRHVDTIVGSGWDIAVDLPEKTLNLSQEQADELSDEIEERWTEFASDPAFWVDAKRQGPMASVLGRAYRHRFGDGEALAEICWDEARGAPYGTFVKLIDPARLSNPFDQADTPDRRDGVELDRYGAADAYWIRTQHPDDDYVWGSSLPSWVRVPRETEWGRPVMVHAFEADRDGQFRGVPPLAPILRKLKQMTQYDEAELKAAMVNAVLAAFITSPGDHGEIAEALTDNEAAERWDKRTLDRFNAYRDAPPKIPAGMAHFLYPGDSVTLTQPGHPNSGFEAFFRAALRNVASTVGLTYEQLTMDWSQVNYSSARAAILEIWRGLTARKDMFAAQFMNQVYRAWLEEAFDKRIIRLPGVAVSFEAAPAAWSRVDWIGPARGWVDPEKEAKAAGLRLDLGISHLEKECAEQGMDWKQVARKRARERRFLASLGLSFPTGDAAKPEPQKTETSDERDARERQEAKAA